MNRIQDRLRNRDVLALKIAVPFLTTAFLWLAKTNDVTVFQAILAFLILTTAFWSYSSRGAENEFGVPIVPLVIGTYWWFFVFGLFWGPRSVPSRLRVFDELTDQSITLTMIAVVIGVVSLLIGSRSKIGSFLDGLKQWDIPEKSRSWTWIRIVMIAGLLLSFAPSAIYVLGSGGRPILILFQTTVPTVAFVILFRNYLRNKVATSDRLLLLAFALLRIVAGISSGWLGSAAEFGIVIGCAYLSERRKIPRWIPVIALVYVFFFQVGKEQYRLRYWSSDDASDKNPITRISYWIDSSLDAWGRAIASGDEEAYSKLFSESLMRTSLLTQVANVLEKTPDLVPYQYGRTYSYFLVTFVPRFIWPEKPSVNDANQFYQVAYGLTAPQDLNRVSIAVGSLGESYMNFGWLGVPTIMFGIGLFLSAYQRLLLSRTSGAFLFAIGVALVPQLMRIEGQLAQYLAGMAQQIIFCVVVFSPVLKRIRAQSPHLKKAIGVHTSVSQITGSPL